MRFTQQQVDTYNARRSRAPEGSPEIGEPKIDLSARPTSLTVAGRETLALLHEIKKRGGQVSGMAQGKQNGVWKLSINWPSSSENRFNQDTLV
jgi:hypothetical protein